MIETQLTSIKLPADLHTAAKREGISFTRTLIEAINIKLNIPNDLQEIEKEIENTKQRLEMLRNRKNEIVEQKEKQELNINDYNSKQLKGVERLKEMYYRDPKEITDDFIKTIANINGVKFIDLKESWNIYVDYYINNNKEKKK